MTRFPGTRNILIEQGIPLTPPDSPYFDVVRVRKPARAEPVECQRQRYCVGCYALRPLADFDGHRNTCRRCTEAMRS